MRMTIRSGMLVGLGLLAAALVASVPLSGAVTAQELRLDAAKVTGPDACGECHKSSVESWKGSHHFTTFKNLPRAKSAKKIAKAMGLKRIKAGSDCLTCHFTTGMNKGKAKPIGGITCESCHGAGKDWIKIHSSYGGKGVTKETEEPAHRDKRLADSKAAGMIMPSDLFAVATNCYGCHTVPNEKLVNTGGHTAGSKFELVAWSQGEVRHNVWYSKSNDAANPARQRMMYVVGKALDLEHALRGVAKATKKKTYAVSMAKRAAAARKDLKAVAKAIKAPEVDEMVAAGGSAKLKLNNAAALTAAADKVAAAAKAFAAAHDGGGFAGIDALLPGADAYKGKASK